MTNIALRYTILPGDSFSKIASDLSKVSGITTTDILNVNQGISDTSLQIGQKLVIPSTDNKGTALTYVVLSGDTLDKIVKGLNSASGSNTTQIVAANPGVKPTALQIGQVINIPDRLTEEATTTTTPDGEASTSVSDAKLVGYWDWTWHHTTPVTGATLGIAFSGWAIVATALKQSAALKNKMAGKNYISLGGGNANGAFTTARLISIMKAIEDGSFGGYNGIAFDVEVGDPGLSSDFEDAFAAAKKEGFDVLVTISHSAPYGISDGAALMTAFFSSEYIDIISPQLYTTGEETQNNYATSHGVEWSQYAAAKAAVAPSLVTAAYYPDAKTYFTKQGVELKGFVQWSLEG